LIGLHLAAVLFYTIKGHPIIVAMISGKIHGLSENDAIDSPSSKKKLRGSWIAPIIFADVASAIAYAIKTYYRRFWQKNTRDPRQLRCGYFLKSK
jgi:hypothetical protein